MAVASYSSDKLCEIKFKTVSISEGENIFDNPLSSLDNTDRVKIFIWESKKNLKPILTGSETKVN